MNTFSKNIAPHVKSEIDKSRQLQESGDYPSAFKHLENAHVLGQESTYWHVKVHYLMLLWGIDQGDLREVFGQFLRAIVSLATAPLLAIGRIPIGNTGGSNVNPTKAMPLKQEHKIIINNAKQK